MMRRLKIFLMTLSILAAGLLFGAATPAVAISSASQADACGALNQLDASQSCGSAAANNVVGSTAGKVVNILSLVIGALAVIMIIVAGIKYVTSGGDSNKVSSAKSTLVYALVGILIAALAQFIVRFVLSKASGA